MTTFEARREKKKKKKTLLMPYANNPRTLFQFCSLDRMIAVFAKSKSLGL